MKFRPLQPGDLERIDAREHLGVDLSRARIHELYLPIVGLLDSNPVAIGGIQPITPWVGEAWLITSKHHRCTISVIRMIASYLLVVPKETGFRRVEACVRADFTRAIRLVRYFGFEYEGTRRSYGKDGEDFLMFARLFQ